MLHEHETNAELARQRTENLMKAAAERLAKNRKWNQEHKSKKAK